VKSNPTGANVVDAAQDLTERSANLLRDSWSWLANNSNDILIALAVGLAIALVLTAARMFGHKLIRSGPGDTVDWRTIFGRVLSRTTLFFIVMAAAQLVVNQTDAPRGIVRTTDILFVIAAAFQFAIWGRELILGFVYHKVGEAEANSTLSSAIGIIRLLVSVALFAIALILILSNLGVNVTGLVAGLGIGGIAIGLAAQGIFSDLFAALSIIFDRPFRKGDTITFGATTGTVVEIGLKSTRIRALTGEEVVISNANLLNMQLQNWAMLQRRRAAMNFGVTYQTPPETLARIAMEAREIVDAQPLATFDRCHAFQFGPSSIDFELVFFIESAAMPDFMAARQAIMLGLMGRFAELDIDFAYPTQANLTLSPDGRATAPYPQVKKE
jgi:small-conductance mechanosensitive channel